MKEPSFPNAVPAGWGLSRRRACAREKPTAVSLQPRKACVYTLLHTHTLAHTRPGTGTRSSGHVSLAPRRRTLTPHPSGGSSPAGNAPHSPPPKAIGRRGGAALGARAARATLPTWRGRSRAKTGELGRLRSLARAVPAVVRRQAAGSSTGEPRWGGAWATGAGLLTGSAGGREGSRRALWSCSRRHAWLPGRRCRRRRKSHDGPAADLCLGSLLVTVPTQGASLFFSHFIFSPQSPPAPGSPACAPNLHPRRTRERPVPAMSLLFWDPSVSSSLSPPGEAHSLGATLSLPKLPAALLRPLFGGPGGGLETDTAPEESRVAKTWLREAAAPGVRESASPRAQQVQLRRASRLLERG